MYFGETEPGIKSAILCVLVLHAVLHLFANLCLLLSENLINSKVHMLAAYIFCNDMLN